MYHLSGNTHQYIIIKSITKFNFIQLKRIKQIEQEKEVLMHGLQAVERARDWYHKQIAAVQDKMKYLGRTNSHTVSSLIKK